MSASLVGSEMCIRDRWNSLAVGLQLASTGRSPEDILPSAGRLAISLRALAQVHVRGPNFQALCQKAWAYGPDATEETEDGPVPETYGQWVATLTRKRKWIDGLSIMAVARRMGQRVNLAHNPFGQDECVYSFGSGDEAA
eukprot:9350529-Alexandrium_andersonii.AAC.1